jgi:prepilin-type N-terminal cleavage/methylation domain-containing protein
MMKNASLQRGLTLVEIAISILIIGVGMAAVIEIYNRARLQRQIELTYDRMDRIVQALSVYAETTGRLPCPADPSVAMSDPPNAPDPNSVLFGWEKGITDPAVLTTLTGGGAPIGTCTSFPAAEGILPFLTLGLKPEDARDGWGRYFTYAVSPVFAVKNDQSGGAATYDTGTVHERCRHPGWVQRNGSYSNKNPIKARFCCAEKAGGNVGSDLRILFTDLVTTPPNLSPARASNNNTTSPPYVAPYGDMHAISVPPATAPLTAPPFNTQIEAPAFVLVSHGPDGLGAYLGNGTTGRNPPANGPELENANANRTFADGPWDTSKTPATNNKYFDDIVRWMTQDGVLAAHGALSCQYP